MTIKTKKNSQHIHVWCVHLAQLVYTYSYTYGSQYTYSKIVILKTFLIGSYSCYVKHNLIIYFQI